jgi:hypothetical protein
MSSRKGNLHTVAMTFVVMIVALACTPAISSFTTSSKYVSFTEAKAITPSSSNSTTLTYSARNDSYAQWTCILNATDKNGATSLVKDTDYTYPSDKTVLFSTLNKTVVYLATITYSYIAASSAMQSLVDLVPLFWVIGIIAVGIAAIYLQLREWR